ncbi:MAG: hypothetical protein IID44_29755 [Planctomycetes bacterium]|nr:hypothetical protein [Planctomycetota bacterium]
MSLSHKLPGIFRCRGKHQQADDLPRFDVEVPHAADLVFDAGSVVAIEQRNLTGCRNLRTSGEQHAGNHFAAQVVPFRHGRFAADDGLDGAVIGSQRASSQG